MSNPSQAYIDIMLNGDNTEFIREMRIRAGRYVQVQPKLAAYYLMIAERLENYHAG